MSDEVNPILEVLKKNIGNYVMIGTHQGILFSSGILIDADKDIVIIKPDGKDVEEYITPSLIKRLRIYKNKVISTDNKEVVEIE